MRRHPAVTASERRLRNGARQNWPLFLALLVVCACSAAFATALWRDARPLILVTIAGESVRDRPDGSFWKRTVFLRHTVAAAWQECASCRDTLDRTRVVEELRRALLHVIADGAYMAEQSSTAGVEAIPRWALQSLEASAALAIADRRNVSEVVGAAADAQGTAEAWNDARRLLLARGIRVSVPTLAASNAGSLQSLFGVQLRANEVSGWALVRGPLTQITLEVLQGPRDTPLTSLRFRHQCAVRVPSNDARTIRILGPSIVSCRLPEPRIDGSSLWLAAERRSVVAAIDVARPVSRIGIQTESTRWRDAITLLGSDQLTELRSDLTTRLGILPTIDSSGTSHLVEDPRGSFIAVARNPQQAQNLLATSAISSASAVFVASTDGCGRPDGLSWNGVALNASIDATTLGVGHRELVTARGGEVLAASREAGGPTIFAVPTLNGAIEPTGMVAAVRCVALALRDMYREPPVTGTVNVSDLSGSRLLWGQREQFTANRRGTRRDFVIAILLALAWAASAILPYPIRKGASVASVARPS